MIDPTTRISPHEISDFKLGGIVVLCEGPDECHVVKTISAELDLDLVQGFKKDGITLVEELRGLATQVNRSELKSVGFLFDNEDGQDSEIDQALSFFYEDLKLQRPTGRTFHSETILNGRPFRSILHRVMPHCLEELFIPQIGNMRHCIDEFILCHGVEAANDAQHAKQVVRAYLAAVDRTNTTIGVALKERHLSCAPPEFDGIRQFLQDLCAP